MKAAQLIQTFFRRWKAKRYIQEIKKEKERQAFLKMMDQRRQEPQSATLKKKPRRQESELESVESVQSIHHGRVKS